MATQLGECGDQAPDAARGDKPARCRGIQVETDGTAVGDDEQSPVGTEEVIQHPRSVGGHAFMIPATPVDPDRADQPTTAAAASLTMLSIVFGNSPSPMVNTVATASPAHSSRPWDSAATSVPGSRIHM